MKRKSIILYSLIATIATFAWSTAFAQASTSTEEPIVREHKGLIWSALHGLQYEFKAGINIGGTSPIPLPQEIRSLDSYRPGLAISIEGNATKWLGAKSQWGITVGVRLDSKRMNTEATVKNYGMEIFNDAGGRTAGLWTGGVKTDVEMSCLTIPILASWRISDRWRISAGPYFSYLMSGDFTGNVYEGHLRTPDATGSIVTFAGENIATYDFSNQLRHFQWGLQVGGSWKAYKHLTVHADLTWGLNDIFEKDFTTISFAMYPIYLNFGFGYIF